ncbi:MAG TPA: hypothetical protein VEQ18_04875 [Candidatus Nitrosocosmicus sp.]|nr:hypothetical protein [Candidatus Nitrosocosmicus sp.]
MAPQRRKPPSTSPSKRDDNEEQAYMLANETKAEDEKRSQAQAAYEGRVRAANIVAKRHQRIGKSSRFYFRFNHFWTDQIDHSF